MRIVKRADDTWGEYDDSFDLTIHVLAEALRSKRVQAVLREEIASIRSRSKGSEMDKRVCSL